MTVYKMINNSLSIVFKVSLLPLSVFGLASFTLAQEGGKPKYQIEEVMVTAQKREESLQETPISITAFSSDMLVRLGVSNIADLAGQSPNVTIQKQGSNSDNVKFGIRGVTTGETQVLADPTVGLYLDGVYIARQTGAMFDIVDLERVEILRGPQGALYGRNTIGGAVNIITSRPTGELGYKQQLKLGNRGYLTNRMAVNSPLLNTGVGDFSASASYLTTEYDGNVRNSVDGSTMGSYESDAARIVLRWDVNDWLAVDYSFDNSDRDSRPDSGQLSHVRPNIASLGGTIYQRAAEEASSTRKGSLSRYFTASGDGNNSKVEGHTLIVSWDLNDISFKSITANRAWDATTDTIDFASFLSDGATVLDGAGGFVPVGTPVSLFRAQSEASQEQWSQEFQILGSLMESRLDYVVGLYYFKEDVKENNPQSFVLPAVLAYGALPADTQDFLCQGDCNGKDAVLSSPLFIYGGESISYAAFGQFEYHVSEKLDLILGLRYTQDKKDVFLQKDRVNNNLPVNADDSWSSINPTLTAAYSWNDSLNSYFTVSSGFRSGGFNGRASSRASFETPFDEEKVISYETGIKSDWWDRRLQVNGSIFYLDYTDRQLTQLDANAAGAATIIVNAGDSSAQGLELEVSAMPTEGLSILASYGYTDIKFNSFVTTFPNSLTGFTIGENIDLSSDPRADLKAVNAPKHSANLALEYEFSATRLGVVSGRIGAVYSSGYVNHPILHLYDSTASNTLIDARLSLSDITVFDGSRLQIALWGKNITNEEVRSTGTDFGILGFASNSYQELATFGLDILFEI